MCLCPEVAGDAALLINPDHISEISDAVDQICCDSNLRFDLIRKGFARAKMFSWERFGQQMLEIYGSA